MLQHSSLELERKARCCWSVNLISKIFSASISNGSDGPFLRAVPCITIGWVISLLLATKFLHLIAVDAPTSIIGIGKDSTILLVLKYNIIITLQ